MLTNFGLLLYIIKHFGLGNLEVRLNEILESVVSKVLLVSDALILAGDTSHRNKLEGR